MRVARDTICPGARLTWRELVFVKNLNSRHVPRSPPGTRSQPANGQDNPRVASPQTLSEADRRIVAAWAADCAERVLGIFEAEAPGDRRPRDAIARTRAYALGELETPAEIRRRFVGGAAARAV